MAHHRLVDRELVERVRGAGAELYAWTCDESALIDRLTGLEVTGNHPTPGAELISSSLRGEPWQNSTPSTLTVGS